MKFKYVGDRPRTETRGHVFEQGKPVEVKGEVDIRKLSGNPHFEQVKARAVKDGDS